METSENKEILAENKLRDKISDYVSTCPSPHVCAKMSNPSEREYCINFVYKQVQKFAMTIAEGTGQLESFLSETMS